MSEKNASRRDVITGAATVVGTSAILIQGDRALAGEPIANTIKPGVDADVPVFRFRQPDGTVVGVPITPETLSKDPGLKGVLDSLRKNAPAAATYGETYEKGPTHDKEHSKAGDHSKGFSRT